MCGHTATMGKTATQQANKNAITLKGSAEIVAEFFNFGINSILYQRGIYPADSFRPTQKYDLTLWVSQDNEVNSYLSNIMEQIKVWLEARVVQRLVLVISNVDTSEVLERWEFIVANEKSPSGDGAEVAGTKDLKTIRKEVQNVIRQITASVTFLPLLDCPCSFNLLIHTSRDAEVPEKWDDSPPGFIANSEQVKLRSFSTSVHKVDTVVSYKCDL
ncbi:mitotic spindle assembly checkpoint protein MAD2A-like isoform X2 [Pollicipes pollicipes]|uniref:mitotic spindle assembly checkpoint protein MAD2A-like isoform X2 n=1 Tax=Pollicipes pollicipes TaxID=41117 RepID=UPI001884DB89|nr:mitotic spindle assembly checkpoint protein MAD2A-like isoform X2 [Pollicipes pollicipes]